MTKPIQDEIDAIAHFAEASRELKRSPFFVEEYRTLSISMREGDSKEQIKGRFPDPNVVGAMFVPFRRVWQQREPCQYNKVANLLKKYIPELRPFIDSVMFDGQRAIVRQLPWFKDITLSVTDVINVWLNTRYMHVGKTAKEGHFTRKDFERLNAEIGSVLFEFYFLFAVQEASICFFNLQQCAESFLRNLKSQGLLPSFSFDSTPEDTNVERKTPGFTPDEDSPQQRVWRLRRRRYYDGFNRFLNLLSLSNPVIATAVSSCNTLDQFLATMQVRLERTEQFGQLAPDAFTHFDGCCDNEATVIKNRRARRGFVAKRNDGVLVWAEDYLSILTDQYLEFREALTAAVFR